MAQYQDFSFEPPSRLEAVAQHADEKQGNCHHRPGSCSDSVMAATPGGRNFRKRHRRRMRNASGGYRRDHLRALAQRVEVDAKEVRIMGSKSELLRTLVAAETYCRSAASHLS